MNTSTSMKHFLQVCSVIILLLMMSSCVSLRFKHQSSQITKEPSGKFWAGAGAVDITPMPGQPMGGFGNDIGKVGIGYWTRLYAKTIYLEDADGNFMLLVSSDLWAFPQGLGDLVLDLLQEDINPAFHITRENILFAATHTHHSQGNYSTSFGYNQGSSARSGFDDEMFQFLGRRIAYSIKLAITNKEEAKVSYAQSQLPGNTRNRSIEAFENNSMSLKQLFYDRVPDPEEYYDSAIDCYSKPKEVYQAIDPSLTSIIVRRKVDNKIISLINNFAVHPTAMGSDNNLYSADVFGVACSMLQNQMEANQQASSNAVVSFFNGASGDTSPNWKSQDRKETIRLGSEIAEEIYKNIGNGEIEMPQSVYCKLEFNNINDKLITLQDEEINCDGLSITRTAHTPAIGKAVKAGAEDGRSIKYIDDEFIIGGRVDECRFNESLVDDNCTETQGNKKELFEAKFAVPSAPVNLPIGVFQIGDLSLVALPGEITAGLGEHIKRNVNTQDANSIPLIIGLANEYISYFTTPAEYALQQYEGGFTVYGPASGLYLSQEAKRINEFGSQTQRHFGVKYNVGPVNLNKGGIKNGDESVWPNNLSPDNFNLAENFVELDWDVEELLFPEYKVASLKSYLPELSVEVLGDGEWTELKHEQTGLGLAQIVVAQNDLQSLNFASFLRKESDRFYWTTVWAYPSDLDKSKSYRMRFFHRSKGLDLTKEIRFIENN